MEILINALVALGLVALCGLPLVLLYPKHRSLWFPLGVIGFGAWMVAGFIHNGHENLASYEYKLVVDSTTGCQDFLSKDGNKIARFDSTGKQVCK